MTKTKFTYHEWHWTREYESLFDLDKNALWWDRAFIAEEEKSRWHRASLNFEDVF